MPFFALLSLNTFPTFPALPCIAVILTLGYHINESSLPIDSSQFQPTRDPGKKQDAKESEKPGYFSSSHQALVVRLAAAVSALWLQLSPGRCTMVQPSWAAPAPGFDTPLLPLSFQSWECWWCPEVAHLGVASFSGLLIQLLSYLCNQGFFTYFPSCYYILGSLPSMCSYLCFLY